MCGIFGSVYLCAYEVAATIRYSANELLLLHHCDSNKPRNLAKSVTAK